MKGCEKKETQARGVEEHSKGEDIERTGQLKLSSSSVSTVREIRNMLLFQFKDAVSSMSMYRCCFS